jgi:hypothetical protein
VTTILWCSPPLCIPTTHHMCLLLSCCSCCCPSGRAVLEHYDLPVFECPLHLEGGSIHSDGQG